MPREEATSTQLIGRMHTLLETLRDGPFARSELLERLGSAYPQSDSGRRMVDRDIERLRELGIVVERSTTRPPVYTLHGGTPHLSDDDLRALALIRDTFGPRHPQSGQVRSIVNRMVANLSSRQRRIYERRQALRVPVDPAIDYTPFAPLIERLEAAISGRRLLTFRYQSTRRTTFTHHRRVEPYEIEFYDRHYYLIAYSYNSRQVHDFRIDRIQYDEHFRERESLPPGLEHGRRLITFRYRLAAEVARGGISQRFIEQRVIDTLPNGDVIIEAQGRSDFFIVQTLLRYRGNAELLEPEELRAQIVEEVHQMAMHYGLLEKE